jgi:hypothetical protein
MRSPPLIERLQVADKEQLGHVPFPDAFHPFARFLLAARTVTDLDPTTWGVSVREPEPGAFPPHLEVLFFESEKGRRWAPIVRGSLHLYGPRDLRDLLERAKPIPGGSTPGRR